MRADAQFQRENKMNKTFVRNRVLPKLCAIFLIYSLAPSQTITSVRARQSTNEQVKRISILWKGGRPAGQIQSLEGTILERKISAGKGTFQGNDRFTSTQEGAFRLDLIASGSQVKSGKGSTLISVLTEKTPFTFFLRDVSAEYPIYLPAYGVAVTEAGDRRSYEQIETDIQQRGLQTNIERMNSEPEESYQEAAQNVRSKVGQTWLGLSRDMRIFGVSEKLDWIQPRLPGSGQSLPETENKPVRYNFMMGRGWGPVDDLTRRLEDGVLPILRGTRVDGGIDYNFTSFVVPERSRLTSQTLRGTHFLVADGLSAGHMLTKEQEAQYNSLLPAESGRDEETVLFMRVEAVNTSSAPRYAWFKTASSSTDVNSQVFYADPLNAWNYEEQNGFGVYKSGRVFAISKLNGKPLPAEESAILLKPGETATFEVFIPHRPITKERAAQLQRADFAERYEECRRFWRQKLDRAAQISVPEQRITEMAQAGLLHLDLISYGLEPNGTLAPNIGIYSPIGSESAPIIQYMDSMGWHDEARRSIMFFLDKQHEDGFIQNFGGYMLETGAALWTMGEHYRYTRDDEWVRQIEPKLLKSCEFILKWRQRNKREELRGKGYGMLEGKTADPEDLFRSFMLNGYHYLGLERVSEMLAKVDPQQSQRLAKEAAAFKADIRTAFFEAMGRSPVVPLGDGSWCPTAPPWAEYRGPLSLFAEGGKWFTHGTVVARDSLLGPLYLVYQEIIDPNEPAATFMLNFHNRLMTERNVAFSQPFYSRHPYVHLRRGEVKPFLKAYYDSFAGLADRQTYSFWEHYFNASPHKTHEEAWHLMQTRWMLYMEDADTLHLLPGIPRAYLENGKRIELSRAASYFGPVSVKVESKLNQDQIVASIQCATDRNLKSITVRLPHPQGRKAVWVKGGTYDPDTEQVRISQFNGVAQVILGFSSQGK